MRSTIWNQVVNGNDESDWLLALGIAGVAWLAAQVLYRLSNGVLKRIADRTRSRVDDVLLETMRAPVIVLVTMIGMVIGYQQLNIPERADLWMQRVFHVAIALCVTWLITRLVDAVLREFLLPNAKRDPRSTEGQLLPAVAGAVKGLLWGLGIVVALNNAGYDVAALLAGIGIGGLALAMAAKDTVANVFGGLTVFADQPFRVGDRVRIDEHDGIVDEVGLRSTRVRTLDGPVVSIPNHRFTDGIVVNVSAEPRRRVRQELGLVLEATPEQVEEAMTILRDIASELHEHLLEDVVVGFTGFTDHSLRLLFIYHVRQRSEVVTVQTQVNLEILRRFRAADVRLAYPTSIQYAAELRPV
jgi:MscS family membrane protein